MFFGLYLVILNNFGGSKMKRQAKELLAVRNGLLLEITNVRHSLETTHSKFENTSDPDLIDSYIYEMNAIHFRYKYLLRQIREFDLTTKELGCKIN